MGFSEAIDVGNEILVQWLLLEEDILHFLDLQSYVIIKFDVEKRKYSLIYSIDVQFRRHLQYPILRNDLVAISLLLCF